MSKGDRIKKIRLTLNLTLEQFSTKVGVTKAAMSNIENGNRNVTEQMIKSICREFNVNENWLRNGIEPMYIQASTFSLDDFMKQHGATDLELQIARAYFELDQDMRKKLIDHFKNCMTGSNKTEAAAPQEPTVEELEKEYKKSRSKSAKKKDSSALNTTAGKGRTGTNN